MHLSQMLIQVVLPREALLPDSPTEAAGPAFLAVELLDGMWEVGLDVAVEVEGAAELAGAVGVNADVRGGFVGSVRCGGGCELCGMVWGEGNGVVGYNRGGGERKRERRTGGRKGRKGSVEGSVGGLKEWGKGMGTRRGSEQARGEYVRTWISYRNLYLVEKLVLAEMVQERSIGSGS